MERLGERWLTGAIDVHHEHQATYLVTAVLSELIQKVANPFAANAPLAVGASPELDPYSLPLQLGELVLRENGWNVRNLGVGLPLRSLSAAVREYRPRLVFLSVSHLADEDRFATEYHEFYESVASEGVAVMLGGRALSVALRTHLIYASFGERMAHLAEFARRVSPPWIAAADVDAVETSVNPSSRVFKNG